MRFITVTQRSHTDWCEVCVGAGETWLYPVIPTDGIQHSGQRLPAAVVHRRPVRNECLHCRAHVPIVHVGPS